MILNHALNHAKSRGLTKPQLRANHVFSPPFRGGRENRDVIMPTEHPAVIKLYNSLQQGDWAA